MARLQATGYRNGYVVVYDPSTWFVFKCAEYIAIGRAASGMPVQKNPCERGSCRPRMDSFLELSLCGWDWLDSRNRLGGGLLGLLWFL